MATYIGLLRAVNLGKQRQVPMHLLRALLESQGYEQVETHIQSGNLRVRTAMRSAARLEADLRRSISAEFGFDVPVVVRTAEQLRHVAEVAEALESPIAADARRYVTFLAREPEPAGVEALHGWHSTTEGARVLGKDVVLFLSEGVQTAKLSNARIEKLTGTVGTARNLTVVRALAQKWG